MTGESVERGPARGTPAEVLFAFLKLGLTSFGGPIAHLGYFRDEFVTRRRWLHDDSYAELVALCQFLPGPASSQVGFALGLSRAGWLGAMAAFVAFTLPSAIILLVFALTSAAVSGPIGTGALNGLKIVAVAIVAQAVLGMARNLCPDRQRASIAVAAVAMIAFLPGATGMIGAIIIGGLAGLVWCKAKAGPAADRLSIPVTRSQGILSLTCFLVLLVFLPLLHQLSQSWAVADSFFRAGALVFGGGHVVLPLLEAEVVAPGWVSADQFLAGYGAAQAVPGPLFTFAAYLGALLEPGPNGMAGATLALLSLFLPGFLILIAVLPFWGTLRQRQDISSAIQGANAAVVGILAAALYDPVFTSAVGDMRDFALALACFVSLVAWKAPSWLVVILAAAGGVGLQLAA
ncbi:chromate efflux transporter [Paracoccus albus]|uniref:chromate efflux transporter n=1 Tax=Paracoccus albus TaxID=3017784 RepID=UPI0022F0A4BE|nr:chromate efflux transporter [Paracoccus albus]WBU61113.1 chromate efflux transporter [Paracoccus albus]